MTWTDDAPLLAGAARGARTIVLTTEAAPAARRARVARHADVIVAGRDAVPAGAAVDALAARGYRRVLVEGGPACSARSPRPACSTSSA